MLRSDSKMYVSSHRKVPWKTQPNHKRRASRPFKDQDILLWKDEILKKKADHNLYRGIALSLYGALYDIQDQSTIRRNLYSNALSISIIGEELPRAHTMAKRLLYPPRSRIYGESLENVYRSVNVGYIRNLMIHV